jgi:hypothetical protein
VQRRHRTENKIVEDFVELCQEGIEQVQGVHKRTLFRVQREEKCQGKTLTEYLNTLEEDLCKECTRVNTQTKC